MLGCNLKAENLTLNSYYPSPIGSFNTLTVSRGANLATVSGNVGIGTSNSYTKLTLAGSLGFTNGSTPMIYVYQSGSSNSERAIIAHSPEFPDWGIFYRDSDDTIRFRSTISGTPDTTMSVDLQHRRIGIGLDDPAVKLHVNTSDSRIARLVSSNGTYTDSSYVFEVQTRFGWGPDGLVTYASPQPILGLKQDGSLWIDSYYHGYGGVTTGTADLAENMVVAEKNLEAGDVVSLSKESRDVEYQNDKNGKPLKTPDPSTLAGIVKTNKNSMPPIGVISTQPGYLFSGNLKKSKPLALAGRVPTKVSSENGAIAIGDRLAASSVPGHAMKATKPGYTVGIALEPFDGAKSKTGKIMVLVQPTWSDGNNSEEIVRLSKENEALKLRLDTLEKKLAQK